MGINKQIYTDIKNHLQQSGLGLKWIDIFSNQYQDPNAKQAIFDKAVFVELPDATWQMKGRNAQTANANINIHVCQFNQAPSYATALGDTPGLGDALLDLDFIDDIHIVMQGFQGTNFNSLKRIRSQQLKQYKPLVVYVMTYATMLVDNQTDRLRNYTQIEAPEPGLNVERNNE